MNNNGFSLIELMIVTIIVAILATLGIPMYQNFVESSKEKVCDTNLLTLQKAVEMYTMEHDTVPGSLSALDDKTIEKAYASVLSGKDAWKIKLAYLIVEGPKWGIAYAAGYGLPSLRCPANPNPSQPSYGLNYRVAGLNSFKFKDSVGDNVVIVADSGGELFDYAGAGGDGTEWDKDFTPFTASYLPSIFRTRAHKKFRILSQPDSFFKGLTKNGKKGTFNSSGMFYPDSS